MPKYQLRLLLLFLVLVAAGGTFTFFAGNPDAIDVGGATMGTTYHVRYFDRQQRNLKAGIDSLLVQVNRSISTYDPRADVTSFNRSPAGIRPRLPYLIPVLSRALAIARASGGAFDPTVMPLVNAWGFGPDTSHQPTQRVIDSLRQFVGYDRIVIKADSVLKTHGSVQLDFGGIGQGYGADVIADFLRAHDIANFIVELGGEGVASGKNLSTGAPWKIGILDPASSRNEQFYKAFVSLQDRAFTTSGNYFNYREHNGRRYGHTLDPRSGYPVEHSLLSASVFAADCATADAWATAFMVMGAEAARIQLEHHPELDALLIISTEEGHTTTYSTPGLRNSLSIEE